VSSDPAGEGRRPTREWGADPDQTARRRLRGRKFYWHADPSVQQYPRHQAREHQKLRPDGSPSDFVVTRWLAPACTVLRQRVTFDNLSPAELGGLLASFEPGRVLPEAPGGGALRLHLGGGKPLGLGSCTAAVSGLDVWSAASRYGGASEVTPDSEAWLREFQAACPAALIDEIWPSLSAVLSDKTVDPARVWYPPGRFWPEQGENTEAFDDPFTFFKVSSGRDLKEDGTSRLIRLPYPADGNQSLRIEPKPRGRNES
jgi:hypothetical protein